MYTIPVHASTRYDVLIGRSPDLSFLTDIARGRSVMLISDDNVFPLYGAAVLNSLAESGCRASRFVFPHGEENKSLAAYAACVEKISEANLDRRGLLIALGGGVVGDLAGFAAATWLRGIDYIQLPTTLLAAVDSSVGGKTALDLGGGKNLIGAFHQPVRVICDTARLSTLPASEYESGCAEVIKCAMLADTGLFQAISDAPVSAQYERVISDCVSLKRDLVERDEFDRGARALLNFGHTIGHAIESRSRYAIPHGQAVAAGMAVITKAAAEKGLCDSSVYTALFALLRRYGLPTSSPFVGDELLPLIARDKKCIGNAVTLVVPARVGHCDTLSVPLKDMPDWLRAGGIA